MPKTPPSKTLDTPSAFIPAGIDVSAAPAKVAAPSKQATQEPIALLASEPLIEKPKTEKNVQEAQAPSTGARFQLASFTDRDAAQAGLKKLNAQYGNALQGARLFVSEATINGNKQVYRVQGVASGSENPAEICATIRSSGGTCVTVK
jgi:hypothetical protein